MAKEKSIPFILKGIHIEEFATFDDCYDSKGTIGITHEFGFGANIMQHSLAVKFTTIFKCTDKPFIKLVIICEFDVEEPSFQVFQNKKTKAYKIPKGFLTHLSVITVGTARGVLHTKLEKTKFEEFLLPTMDISNILEEDLVINI